jgi:hypothetical protein
MAADRPSRLRRRAALVFASALLGLSAFSQAQAATSARLSVPAEATPGENVTVNGSHFHSGQRGNLTYNGAVIEGFKASSSGSFSKAFTIPSKARLGRGRISAKTTSGTLLATTTLTTRRRHLPRRRARRRARRRRPRRARRRRPRRARRRRPRRARRRRPHPQATATAGAAEAPRASTTST